MVVARRLARTSPGGSREKLRGGRMSDLPPVSCGAVALRRILRDQSFDLRGLDVVGFRAWLGRHLGRWQKDATFVQQVKIRDLRRAKPDLGEQERQVRQLTAVDAASPAFTHLTALERQ